MIETVHGGATGFTVGVEEEYQLVDAETRALRSHATAVRREDWTGELIPELQETMVEIGTPICSSAAETHRELARLRFQSGTVAAAHGLTIVAAGTHPFSDWKGHRRPRLERYEGIEARYGRIARDEHIFGMHVHVATPNGTDRIALCNIIRHYLPQLLALSASSPFIDAEDTGFVSYRNIQWRRWPTSGVPPRFSSEAELATYTRMALDAGVIGDPYNLYWSLRPHPEYPTVEFRVMDACPSIRDAAAIAALCRALVHAATTGRLTDDAPRRFSSSLEQELLRANEWCAARDGLDAPWIDATNGGAQLPMRAAIRRLLERTAASFDDLGDVDSPADIEAILSRGNAANRLRAAARERNMMELVDWLIEETLSGTGLDRRAAVRDDS